MLPKTNSRPFAPAPDRRGTATRKAPQSPSSRSLPPEHWAKRTAAYLSDPLLLLERDFLRCCIPNYDHPRIRIAVPHSIEVLADLTTNALGVTSCGCDE